MNDEVDKFLKSPITSNFGVELAAATDFIYSMTGVNRYGVWLANDKSRIKEQLERCTADGVSFAWFSSYEMSEGYNPKWGWLNATYPQGNPLQDTDSVCAHIVEVAGRDPMTVELAWDDPGGGTVGMVPQSVRDEGNNYYNKLPNNSIGKFYLAGTAAAVWAIFYPQGLLAENNGVQNYADPLQGGVDFIKQMGGTFSGSGTSKPPSQNPNKKPPASGGSDTGKNPIETLKFPTLTGKVLSLDLGILREMGGSVKLTKLGNPNMFKPEGPTKSTQTKPGGNNSTNTGNSNANKPNKPPSTKPSGSLKPVSDISTLLSQTVGNGQCYALANWWAVHNGTPELVPGNAKENAQFRPYPEQPLAWAAANIGGDFDWNAWGWDVLYNTKWEDAKAGDIACMGTGTHAPTARIGHVVVIKDNANGNVGFYEQNGVNGQIVAETGNSNYKFLIGMTSTYNYWDCSPKILIRKR